MLQFTASSVYLSVSLRRQGAPGPYLQQHHGADDEAATQPEHDLVGLDLESVAVETEHVAQRRAECDDPDDDDVGPTNPRKEDTGRLLLVCIVLRSVLGTTSFSCVQSSRARC